MRILITGSNGQLGKELLSIIKKGKAEIGEISNVIISSKVFGVDVDILDITNIKKVRRKMYELKPDVVINCAAATNVEGCERNKDLAFKVNSLGPRNLAIVCQELNAAMVQISTDYVFSSTSNKPLAEFDVPDPISVYGKTKLLGEKYVQEFCSKYFIVRTAWLYGHVGKNFVYTMMKLGKENSEINIVNDQFGNPTNANDLAYHILKLIEFEEYGIYHCSGKGECSWYDFASEIINLSGEKCKVNPCTSDEYKSSVKRPKYSALDNMMLRNTIGDEMRDWKDAIKSFILSAK